MFLNVIIFIIINGKKINFNGKREGDLELVNLNIFCFSKGVKVNYKIEVVLVFVVKLLIFLVYALFVFD